MWSQWPWKPKLRNSTLACPSATKNITSIEIERSAMHLTLQHNHSLVCSSKTEWIQEKHAKKKAKTNVLIEMREESWRHLIYYCWKVIGSINVKLVPELCQPNIHCSKPHFVFHYKINGILGNLKQTESKTNGEK